MASSHSIVSPSEMARQGGRLRQPDNISHSDPSTTTRSPSSNNGGLSSSIRSPHLYNEQWHDAGPASVGSPSSSPAARAPRPERKLPPTSGGLSPQYIHPQIDGALGHPSEDRLGRYDSKRVMFALPAHATDSGGGQKATHRTPTQQALVSIASSASIMPPPPPEDEEYDDGLVPEEDGPPPPPPDFADFDTVFENRGDHSNELGNSFSMYSLPPPPPSPASSDAHARLAPLMSMYSIPPPPPTSSSALSLLDGLDSRSPARRPHDRAVSMFTDLDAELSKLGIEQVDDEDEAGPPPPPPENFDEQGVSDALDGTHSAVGASGPTTGPLHTCEGEQSAAHAGPHPTGFFTTMKKFFQGRALHRKTEPTSPMHESNPSSVDLRDTRQVLVAGEAGHEEVLVPEVQNIPTQYALGPSMRMYSPPSRLSVTSLDSTTKAIASPRLRREAAARANEVLADLRRRNFLAEKEHWARIGKLREQVYHKKMYVEELKRHQKEREERKASPAHPAPPDHPSSLDRKRLMEGVRSRMHEAYHCESTVDAASRWADNPDMSGRGYMSHPYIDESLTLKALAPQRPEDSHLLVNYTAQSPGFRDTPYAAQGVAPVHHSRPIPKITPSKSALESKSPPKKLVSTWRRDD